MKRCPVPEHDDRHPSLHVSVEDGVGLLHCFGLCPTEAVLAAIRKTFADLYPDGQRARKAIPDLGPMLTAAEADPKLRKRRNRTSCLSVLREYARIARASGSLTVHPSDRDVAVRVGLSRAAVQSARAVLVDLGYLTPAGGRRARRDAAEWRLTPRAKPGHNSQREQRTRAREAKPDPTSDLWRYGYLGPRAAAIFRYIERYTEWEPDFEDIFETVGAAKDPRTVRKHLAALVAHGLVTDTGSGFTVGPRSVEQVAASLGLAGNPVTAAQKARHVEEKAYFREALAVAEWRRRQLVPGYAVRGRSVAPVLDEGLAPLRRARSLDTSGFTTGGPPLLTLANRRSARGPGWPPAAWLRTRPRRGPDGARPPGLASRPSPRCLRRAGPPGVRPP